ncbi:MAG: DUF1566 domain-containing protein, partial [Proteobacteria bacterium]|nr:DUF1566 domain-containing protein [Pseudomonadota bacterium]
WTYSAPSPAVVTVSEGEMSTVQYTVTNQSFKPKTLILKPTIGLSAFPCYLAGKGSTCILTLTVNGSLIPQQGIHTGPILCEQANSNQCYGPALLNSLDIRLTQVPPVVRYTVVPSAGANGSISPNSAQTVVSGENISFTATPAAGYGVENWYVDGNQVQAGGTSYTLSNVTANHTVSVSFGLATITPNLSTLALSVDNVVSNPTLTGKPRKITLTNTGTIPATNVQVTSNNWPIDTIFDASGCGTIPPNGGSCEITVTPGATASNTCTTGTAPTSSLNISADGGLFQTVNVYILSFGCQYQGGYVFAVDDTTVDTGSIGGKVVSLVDQASRYDGGIIWSSNNSGTVVYNSIWGIALGSTASSPLPNATQPPAYPATFVTGQANCTGSYDGECNTNNVFIFYSAPNTMPSINLNFYAVGRCKAYTGGGFSNWYLPAICEIGPASGGSNCAVNTPNIVSNIPGLLSSTSNPDTDCSFGNNCLNGYYWSSTELATNPHDGIWTQYFDSSGSSQNAVFFKYNSNGVRCVRIF